jgi:hypothetical protein
MRAMVEGAINRHIDQQQLGVIEIAERDERELLRLWAMQR